MLRRQGADHPSHRLVIYGGLEMASPQVGTGNLLHLPMIQVDMPMKRR